MTRIKIVPYIADEYKLSMLITIKDGMSGDINLYNVKDIRNWQDFFERSLNWLIYDRPEFETMLWETLFINKYKKDGPASVVSKLCGKQIGNEKRLVVCQHLIVDVRS